MSVTLDKEVVCGHLSVQSIELANDDVGSKLATLQAAVDRLTAMRPVPSGLHGTYLLVDGPAGASVWASALHSDPVGGDLPLFASPLKSGLSRAAIVNHSIHFGSVLECDDDGLNLHVHAAGGPFQADDSPNNFTTVSTNQMTNVGLTWTLSTANGLVTTFSFDEANSTLSYTQPDGDVFIYAGPFPRVGNPGGTYDHGGNVDEQELRLLGKYELARTGATAPDPA